MTIVQFFLEFDNNVTILIAVLTLVFHIWDRLSFFIISHIFVLFILLNFILLWLIYFIKYFMRLTWCNFFLITEVWFIWIDSLMLNNFAHLDDFLYFYGSLTLLWMWVLSCLKFASAAINEFAFLLSFIEISLSCFDFVVD
jgi:hypothetical protein